MLIFESWYWLPPSNCSVPNTNSLFQTLFYSGKVRSVTEAVVSSVIFSKICYCHSHLTSSIWPFKSLVSAVASIMFSLMPTAGQNFPFGRKGWESGFPFLNYSSKNLMQAEAVLQPA